MTDNINNEEKKKGIDRMVKDAIERVLASEAEQSAKHAAAAEAAAEAQAEAAPAAEKAPARRKPRAKKPAAGEAAAAPAPAPAAAAPAEEAPPQPAPRKRGRPKSKPAAEQPAPATKEHAPQPERHPEQPAKPPKKPASQRKVRRVDIAKLNESDELSPSQLFNSNKLALPLRSATAQEKKPANRDFKLHIIPLGGLGEVGKNMMLLEYNDDILVVDGGLSFPEDGMYGIDLVIPDYSYLIENRDKVRAFLLTHGHEDHIGAMPYILRDVPAPVYGSTLTLGLLRGKLNEHRIEADLRQVSAREEISVGPFKVEFIRLTHSIPDSMGLAVHTPVGTVLIISDFKMDMSPIDGKLMDFGRISALGEKGVLLLMSDSTNVEKEGFSASERTVGAHMERFFYDAPGRIIVTSFASHVHRAQQVLWAAERCGRKVAVVGRGMQNMFAIAASLGYLDIPPKLVIDIDRIHDFPSNKIVVITTGSQGEPLSGLTRMSSGEHRQVHIIPGDTVIISATPIPGNETTVAKTVDNLFRLGATVIHERNQCVHVSGHASREELKVLLNMVKPKFFMPIHGEYRMLYKHCALAQQVGMPEENTFVMENGKVLELSRRHCQINGSVHSGMVLIDGLGVGDVGATVLKERRQLSDSGVIVLSLIYTKQKRPRLLAGPEIYTRGFIFEKEYEHIIGEMKDKVAALCSPERLADITLNDLRNQLRSGLTKYVSERTGRKPVIMAVICEI